MATTSLKAKAGGFLAAVLIVWAVLMLVGCSGTSAASSAKSASSTPMSSASASAESDATTTVSAASIDAVESMLAAVPEKADITANETIANDADSEHAVEVSGEAAEYANTLVQKKGDSNSGDEADFYGDNAAIFATDGAAVNLSEMIVETDGTHANGVFSYGEGTTVNIVDSVIETSGNCSGGLMTTGGGTMNATNLRISTSGNSSAAIRSDRGGGTVNVDKGVYTTSGTGSPVIYSTADITVSNAKLESTASQGVVVEGKNSVTLNNVELIADNNKKNSDKSSFYQAVMIYQSMSGDAASGQSSFAMNGGSLTNANGDVFFVNNTVTSIELNGAAITNNGGGAFLRAAAAGWGSEGSNGGQVIMTATDQVIDGDMIVDEVSLLNLYLKGSSAFTGAVNPDGAAGSVYVEIADGSTWTLTGDSYITSLTCAEGAINLNGHTLYVNGEAYDGTSASSGTAIEIMVSESTGGHGGTPPSGGSGSHGASSGGTPPEKPSGSSSSANAS